MLRAFTQRINSQRATSVSIAAPLKGWNARDALGAMDKMYAVEMRNFWPGTSDVILRNGFTEHATGIPTQVESLISYQSGTSSKLFAAAGMEIYNVTAGGAVGAPDVAGLLNPRFQYTNITTPGGSYVMLLNGADKMQVYDGSAWHEDGDGAPYDITNVDTADCSNLTLFKNRIWLIQDDTLKAWYLPVNSIGGAAVALDMSSVAQDGGYLVAAATWTLDAGYGMDDNLVFITSTGEVIVWRLTDPTAPTGIALIGVYKLGSPVGKRCLMKYGGDLLVLCQDGVVPMASALQSSRLDPRVSLTDIITFAVSTSISQYSANFGWQMAYFPKENQLYLNVPKSEGSQQQQYVMNTITKAWCNFTGWEANCFETFNDNLYFGGDGFVAQAWNGTDDDGTNIDAFCLQSFQYYKDANEKQCKMIRPHFLTNGNPSVYGNVNVDFDLSDTTAELIFSPTSYASWDSAVWDADVWAGGITPFAEWQGATAIGYCFAPVIKTASQGIEVRWVSTDMVFEGGGIL